MTFPYATLLALGTSLAAALTPISRASTQDSVRTPVAAPAPAPAPARPVAFGVGEKLTYSVAVGGARVGEGSMSIVGEEDVRGTSTYHSVFDVQGGIIFFHVHDRLESWFDPTTMSSYRFVQQINEGGYHKQRYFEIYPERRVLHQTGYEEQPTVEGPLDDGSFMYFVRTMPLAVGETYTYNRYFRPDKNPVIVKVLRRERVKVPAGTFDCLVLQPVIKSGGIFADGGEAYMWVTDDERRMMVQFKAKVPLLKTLDLFLKSYTPPTTSATGAQ